MPDKTEPRINRTTPHDPGMRRKSATIRDVAAHASVSHQTVARFLNGDSSVKAPAQERIRAAIAALNYRTNRTARSLKTGRSNTIGLLILEIDDPGPARTVKGAIRAARESGYVLDTFALETGDAQELEEVLESVRHQNLDALFSLAYTDHMTHTLRSASLPVPLLLSESLAGTEDEPLSDPPSAGIAEAVGHLAKLGHTRIAHVSGDLTWLGARRRAHAYEQAIQEHGMESAGILRGDWSARSGYDAIMRLGTDLDFTAVIVASDRMALGVIRALNVRGLRVPQDVSVTGIDDMPDIAFSSPPLTTLHVDFEGDGHHAFMCMLARLHGLPNPEKPLVPAPLIVRDSTGPAPTHR